MFCPSCGANVSQGAPFCPNCGTSLPAQPAPGYSAIPQPAAIPASAGGAGYPAAFAAGYASWGSRAVGFIVDAILIGIGMALLYLPLAGIVAGLAGGVVGHGAGNGLCCMFLVLFPLATLLIGLYNGVYLIAQRGYSIGQGLVKVKVVDINGNLLTQGTAFIRLLVRAAFGFIPFLPALDLLWPLWDQRGQTLHDKAVNCYVVNNPQGY